MSSKINQKEFFKKFNITASEFKAAGLPWTDIVSIHSDYAEKIPDLTLAGNSIVERLSGRVKVHSLRMRVKDADHVVEKIVRKNRLNPDDPIGLENYSSRLTDLIGIRILHLFKSDWCEIDKLIRDTWELAETPTIYIREGDNPDVPQELDCKTEIHPYGYRSVHYLIKFQPTKQQLVAEIQVRTIFEEGWSEIDHKVRYPYDLENNILLPFLMTFNRLAGQADEMGSFAMHLKTSLAENQEELLTYRKEKESILEELEEYKNSVKADKAEKDRLQGIIRKLRNSMAHGAEIQDTSQMPLGLQGSSLFDPLMTTRCGNCRNVLPPNYAFIKGLAAGLVPCPYCGSKL